MSGKTVKRFRRQVRKELKAKQKELSNDIVIQFEMYCTGLSFWGKVNLCWYILTKCNKTKGENHGKIITGLAGAGNQPNQNIGNKSA
jgi:hypothetical protein